MPQRSWAQTKFMYSIRNHDNRRRTSFPTHLDGQRRRLSLPDFARLFGTVSRDIPQSTQSMIRRYDFGYRYLTRQQRDEVILTVLKRTSSPALTVAGDKGAWSRWERGWSENLSEFARSRNMARLVPKYIRRGQPLRLFGDYATPSQKDFELNYFRILRKWLFEKYLERVESVYEFGCGTGYNLAALAKIYPDKNLFGLDWSKASIKIVNSLSRIYGWKMHGLPFDFSAPNTSLDIKPNSAIMTFTALEQTGTKYGKFLRFLMKKKPAICIHVEPIVEWYDQHDLLDYLAIVFHKRRHYLEGFVPELMRLKSREKLEILKLQRSHFGSLYTDGYSQVIWKPT